MSPRPPPPPASFLFLVSGIAYTLDAVRVYHQPKAGPGVVRAAKPWRGLSAFVVGVSAFSRYSEARAAAWANHMALEAQAVEVGVLS